MTTSQPEQQQQQQQPPPPPPLSPSSSVTSKLPEWLRKLVFAIQAHTGLTHHASVVLTGALLVYIVSGKAGRRADPLSNLAGYVYPLYMSFKALKTPSHEDDTQWLMYWMVFGSLNLFEGFSGKLWSWIPLYTYAKCGFLAWCFLPRTRGAEVLYRRVIEPWLEQYEEQIDEASSQAHQRVLSVISSASSRLFPSSASPSINNLIEQLPPSTSTSSFQ